jgi:hypothetical protein
MDKGKIIFKDKKISNEVNMVAVNVINSNVVLDNESTIKYIQQLNPLQLIAYEIAKSRLKTSFDIEKSIGFKSFIN